VSNNRRNFTGKSSFLKIIPFALFGKVDGITKKQIINWKNKKQGEVILKLSKNGVEYTIHRGIKPDIISILKDGTEMSQSSNKKVFQTEFEDTVLGIDFDTFMNVVYCDTNNMVSILNASKPVKRDYIEKLFNLYYFTQLKDVGNAKKRSIETAISKLETDIGLIDNNVNNLNGNIRKYNNDKITIKIDIDNIYNNISILDDTTSKVIKETHITKLNDLKEEKITIDNEKSTLNILVEKVKAKVFYCKSFKTDDSYSKSDIDKLEESISQITESIAGLDNDVTDCAAKLDKTDIEQILANKNKYTILYNEDLKSYQENEGVLKSIDKIIKQKEKELKSKPKDGTCPTCMQTVDFEHIKEEYTKILDGHREEYSILAIANDQKQKNIKTLTGFIDESLEAEELYN
jgi:DNA repair exonuclease SbcCD ATPase subunit